ncbi:transporter [Aureimonas glaciei]|uniref:TRAP transporter small permease protein n=1 Tax=Aureimonas glaciei TaxID=1776957 RepID=A0A916Y7B5_9HYPH|nr:transporter [Aureimonas glaciei]
MRSAFLSVERRITQAAVFFGCLGLVLAALAGLYQVVARFILFQSASWSEPFVQLTLIWMTYLALAGAMRTGTLISVDLLRTLSHGRAKAVLDGFTTLAVFALLAVLLWFGSVLVWRVRFQSIAGLNISASWAYAAVPTGALLSIFALFAHALNPPAATDIDIASDSAG